MSVVSFLFFCSNRGYSFSSSKGVRAALSLEELPSGTSEVPHAEEGEGDEDRGEDDAAGNR